MNRRQLLKGLGAALGLAAVGVELPAVARDPLPFISELDVATVYSEVPWRFYMSDVTWSDEEISLDWNIPEPCKGAWRAIWDASDEMEPA